MAQPAIAAAMGVSLSTAITAPVYGHCGVEVVFEIAKVRDHIAIRS
jgi:hypothetical protein